jgi:hypothetical protein
MATKFILNGRKIDQMARTYTNISHCKILQNLPTLEFLAWKSGKPVATCREKTVWPEMFGKMTKTF